MSTASVSIASGEILCVVGARPNFMKIAPILAAMKASVPSIPACLVHTGQHYDAVMNQQYLDALGISSPDVNLEVGSSSHAVQTAEIMKRFEPVVDARKPAAVLVVGDVNSTIACALVAAKKGVPVIHVESGLRSFDRRMPEEINRILTDAISDLLFTSERDARENLLREGVNSSRIVFVGNVMIDTLRQNLARAISADVTLSRDGKIQRLTEFAVLTLHRPSNVDDQQTLRSLLSTLRELGEQLPIVFPVHPRTRSRIDEFGLASLVDGRHLIGLPPVGYLEMLGLMKVARLVLTDSGGIQEETTALGVPCMTLRENTERPITVTEGTNTIVGVDPSRIRKEFNEVVQGGGKQGRIPEYWDGLASSRIAGAINAWLAGRDSA